MVLRFWKHFYFLDAFCNLHDYRTPWKNQYHPQERKTKTCQIKKCNTQYIIQHYIQEEWAQQNYNTSAEYSKYLMSQSQAHAVKHEQLAEKGMPQKSQFCLIFTLIDQAGWNHKKRPSFNHKEKLNLLFQKIEMAIVAVVQTCVSSKLLWMRNDVPCKSLAHWVIHCLGQEQPVCMIELCPHYFRWF